MTLAAKELKLVTKYQYKSISNGDSSVIFHICLVSFSDSKKPNTKDAICVFPNKDSMFKQLIEQICPTSN